MSSVKSVVVIYLLLTSVLLSKGPTYVSIGVFQQEQRTFYSMDDGLPSNDIRDIASTDNGTIFAATAKGLAVFIDGEWSVVEQMENVDVWMLASKDNELAVFGGTENDQIVAGGNIYLIKNGFLE